MKNLKTQTKEVIQTYIKEASLASFDSVTNELIISTKKKIYVFSVADKQITKEISVINDDDDIIISTQYLAEDMTLCVVTAYGKIYVVETDTSGIDCVGTMAQGFVKAEWSPDMELFVLITGNDTFVLMTRYFDDVCEFDLHTTESGEAEQVNVGWGKKETQFHGSEGKQAAKVLKPETASERLSYDSGDTKISWRGDGQYFAISSINKRNNCRFIRIYNRDGVLQNTNEVINGLEETLSWRPSGNLIVSSQRKPNKHDIIFFEKNGLQHGEFTLPYGKDEKLIIDCKWNSNSDVLLLLLKDCQSDNSYTLLLWTTSNYHWYLKKEIRLVNQLEKPLLFWDSDQSYVLHIVKSDGLYEQHHFQHCITQSYHGDNLAMVAVIDANKILATPFKNMVIPPPMSAFQLTLPTNINCITFGINDDKHNILVQLADGNFNIAIFDNDHGNYKLECLHFENEQGNSTQLSHLQWYHTVKAVCVETSLDGNYIVSLQIDRDKKVITKSCVLKVEEKIYSLGCTMQDDSDRKLIVQDDKGLIYTVTEDFHSYNPIHIRLTQPCSHIECVSWNNQLVVFGLTSHFRLYMNDRELATDCTSFLLHSEFLLLTTHSHTLRSVYLSSLFASLKQENIESDKNQFLDEAFRRVERGSKIITAVKQGTAVILQMPRGNLECINPRALVVTYLQKLLDNLEYGKAMEVMRKNRINLNLIFDHNPKLFLENVQKFLVEVKAVDRINQFLTDLGAEDVCTNLYYPYYYHGIAKKDGSISKVTLPGKVDTVCQSVRRAIEEISTDNITKKENQKGIRESFFLCLLTTYAKETKADLESVLMKIKHLKDNPSSCETLNYDAALKYVLYLVDVNLLYDVALGLYDFDIVLMVAQKSQKDPKEYLPFLNNFKNMETNYQRYSIDKYLKRYKKALQHLSKCEDRFNELVEFVREHRLHREGLKLFKVTTQQHKQLSLQYGDYLMTQKLYEDAGVVYARNKFHKEAMTAFLKTTNWNAVLLQAHALNYSANQMHQLCRELVSSLKSHRMYDAAATILETYLKDEEECVVCLLEGRLWFRALHVIHSHEREDLLETNFKPSIIEQADQTCEQIQEISTKFNKYKERLILVEENREKAEIEFAQGLRDDPANDLMSETTSIAGESATSLGSRGTRSTGRTNKSRSKAGRRKYSLKEGSKHEDFALREELALLANTTDRLKDDISSLLQVLVLFFYEEKASIIQSNFTELITLIEESHKSIWHPKSQPIDNQTEFGPEATVQSIIEKRQNINNDTATPNDLPNPTLPALRKDVHWKLHLLRS